jgi:hypothetical protein
MNRPDKHFNKFLKQRRKLEVYLIRSEDVKQSHAAAIESYIEKHVGLDLEGKHLEPV